MSMETRGFTVITHGQSSRELVDTTALLYTPHINLAVQPGGEPELSEEEVRRFHEFFSVNVSTSTKNNFQSVTFIDTPGEQPLLCCLKHSLVNNFCGFAGMIDGDVKYRFDPGKIITRLANVADLVWVFLDPHGSSTCTRTMQCVKELNDRGMQHKMNFFLTKADTVESVQDLNKLTVQLTQRFATQLSDTHAIAVPAIWIPGDNRRGIMPEEDNALPTLLDIIKRSIQKKVQASMERLRKDAGMVIASVDKTLDEEASRSKMHEGIIRQQWYLVPLTFLLWLAMTADVLLSFQAYLPATIMQDFYVIQAVATTAQPYAAYTDSLASLGLPGLFMRLIAFLGVLVALAATKKFLAWRLSGTALQSDDEVSKQKSYRDIAENMLGLHKEVSQAYVDAAKAPEFTANVLKRRKVLVSEEPSDIARKL
jgi:hypothetical protein